MAAPPGFAQAVLAQGGWPQTPQNVGYLNQWHQFEQSPDANNPFNTTQPMAGAQATNSAGVRSYPNPQVGIQATIQTLKNGYYPNLVAALASGNPYAHAAAIAPDLRTWGSHSFADFLLSGNRGPSQAAPNGNTPVGGGGGVSSPVQAPAAAPSPSLNLTVTPSSSPLANPVVQNILQSNDQLLGIQAPNFAAMPSLRPTVTPTVTPGAAPAQQQGKHTTTGSTGQLTYSIQGHETPATKNAISLAEDYLGTPYVWGGDKPGGFDCSGLLQYVWARAGVNIPRTSYDQFRFGNPVQKSKLQPGDAVFFTGSDPMNGLPGHVAMYIGNGKVIQAPHTGTDVQISNLNSIPGYQGARRYA